MVNAAGKFGPYNQPGPAPTTSVIGVAHARALPLGGQSGSDLVRSRIALRVRLRSVQPGDRLPDAGVLAEELGISEITVRRALEGMCQDGLLDRRRGRAGGTFVAQGWDTVVALMHDAEEAWVPSADRQRARSRSSTDTTRRTHSRSPRPRRAPRTYSGSASMRAPTCIVRS